VIASTNLVLNYNLAPSLIIFGYQIDAKIASGLFDACIGKG